MVQKLNGQSSSVELAQNTETGYVLSLYKSCRSFSSTLLVKMQSSWRWAIVVHSYPNRSSSERRRYQTTRIYPQLWAAVGFHARDQNVNVSVWTGSFLWYNYDHRNLIGFKELFTQFYLASNSSQLNKTWILAPKTICCIWNDTDHEP